LLSECKQIANQLESDCMAIAKREQGYKAIAWRFQSNERLKSDYGAMKKIAIAKRSLSNYGAPVEWSHCNCKVISNKLHKLHRDCIATAKRLQKHLQGDFSSSANKMQSIWLAIAKRLQSDWKAIGATKRVQSSYIVIAKRLQSNCESIA
jgi:hypothetical protein